jgi:bifunctional non-homologous end joining protein LigD
MTSAAAPAGYLGDMGTLRSYRDKRDFEETPEPAGETGEDRGGQESLPRFVVQEHHARRLHWDFRLERDGVLVSWALPRGVPEDPKRNNLAVHVEDHPLEYGSFEGDIPRGNYGAGQVSIWDRGTYETHKWRMHGPKGEVMITLHGERVHGRYVLFQTRDDQWMIHRMDPPEDPHREAMPESITPMLAKGTDAIPSPDRGWAYEFKWDGARAVIFNDRGSLRVVSRTQEDLTKRYPELRAMTEALGSHTVILDGEIVALAPDGVPRFEQLQQRIGLSGETEIRRKMKQVPVYYFAFDLLYLDGHRLGDRPYRERRELLQALALSGPAWQTPEHQDGHGAAMLDASRASGLEGIVAKRLDSVYEEGRRSAAWLKIKNRHRQDLVIGGWLDGEGKREGLPGALLVGYWEGDHLVYAGRVGTGFTDATLGRLAALMEPLGREESPFGRGRPPARSHFVEPRLVGAFELADWTRADQVRAGVYKGLRDDVDPRQVIRERPEA